MSVIQSKRDEAETEFLIKATVSQNTCGGFTAGMGTTVIF